MSPLGEYERKWAEWLIGVRRRRAAFLAGKLPKNEARKRSDAARDVLGAIHEEWLQTELRAAARVCTFRLGRWFNEARRLKRPRVLR